MSTIELEVHKVRLVRQILGMEDENMLHKIGLLLKGYSPVVSQQEMPEKRKLGILNGKARIVFKDDFEMTTEELLGMQ